MTREEGIKAKMKTWGVDPNNMDSDMAYLLSRNEELQRRVEKMEKVVGKARDLSNTIGNPFVQHAMLHAALPRLIDNMQAELEGLDAADATDDVWHDAPLFHNAADTTEE